MSSSGGALHAPVLLSQVATQAANTVLANITGGAAAPTATSVTQLRALVGLTLANSDTVTAAFGQIAVDTPRQNTAAYDILVAVTLSVTAAVGGSLNAGVGTSATPTVNAITGALAAAFSFSPVFIVPAGYYLSITHTGTITVGTPLTVAMAI